MRPAAAIPWRPASSRTPLRRGPCSRPWGPRSLAQHAAHLAGALEAAAEARRRASSRVFYQQWGLT
eukprot:7397854-Alexandrium_andersonii.AAC.1